MNVIGRVTASKANCIFIKVVLENLALNGSVAARCGVPVTVFVLCPNGSVKFVTAYYIIAETANTVVVAIVVSYFICRNAMSARSGVPVSRSVRFPAFVIGVIVIVVPKAAVADSVVVFIGMCGFVGRLDVMRAVCFVPMVSFVVRPEIVICVLVTVIPKARVTVTVVVFVGMRAFFGGVYRVCAGGIFPVLFFVALPLLLIGMLVIVIPNALVADSIVVFVNVGALVLGIYCM